MRRSGIGRRALVCALLVVGHCLVACSTLEVTLKDPAEGQNFAQVPDEAEFAQRVSLFFGGKRVVTVEEERNLDLGELHSVVVRSNFLYSLAGVLSLGFWQPLDLEYYLTQAKKHTCDP